MNFVFELSDNDEIKRGLSAKRKASLHHRFVKQKNMDKEEILGRSKMNHKVGEDSKCIKRINQCNRKQVGRNSKSRDRGGREVLKDRW